MMIRLSIGLAALLVVGLSAHGDWTYEKSVDEFTDEVTHMGTTAGGTKDGKMAAMSVSCRDDDLYFVWLVENTYPRAANSVVDLKFRWDDEEIGRAKVLGLGQGLAATSDFPDTSPHPHVWARKAMEHDKLRINFAQRQGVPVTATYTMKGAKDAIRKVLAGCGIEDLDVPERTE